MHSDLLKYAEMGTSFFLSVKKEYENQKLFYLNTNFLKKNFKCCFLSTHTYLLFYIQDLVISKY